MRRGRTSTESAKHSATRFKLLLLVLGVVLVHSLVKLFLSFPIFSSLLFMFGILLYFYLSADLITSFWHSSARVETRFWMGYTLGLSLNFLFAPDSPIHIHKWPFLREHMSSTSITFIGTLFAAVVAYSVYMLEKSSHRKMLEKRPMYHHRFRRQTSQGIKTGSSLITDSLFDKVSSASLSSLFQHAIATHMNQQQTSMKRSKSLFFDHSSTIHEISDDDEDDAQHHFHHHHHQQNENPLVEKEKTEQQMLKKSPKMELKKTPLLPPLENEDLKLKTSNMASSTTSIRRSSISGVTGHHRPTYSAGEFASVVMDVMNSKGTNNLNNMNRLIHKKNSAPSAEEVILSAEEKLLQVKTSLDQLDSLLVPQTVRHYLSFQKILTNEQNILRIFRECNKAELNFLIDNLNLGLVFFKIENHGRSSHNSSSKTNNSSGLTVDGQINAAPTITTTSTSTNSLASSSSNVVLVENQHRTELVELLCRSRIGDLSIESRASLIDSLMAARLLTNPDTAETAQRCALNIILNTPTEKLSRLKTLCDSKGSILTMHKLVYNEIHDPTIRDAALAYIVRQARRQEAVLKMGGVPAKKIQAMGAWRKIVSDIDDTLVSSGGRYPAGIDSTYPHHSLYPGVICFYKELDLGSHPDVDNGVWPSDGSKLGNLVFLSARPHVYKDMTERRVYQKFEKLIHANNLHSMPMLLPGDIDSGRDYMMNGNFEPMAQKKLKNFVEYEALYPEYKHIFIGDNGQADVRAGQLMKEKYGDRIERIYIHEVQAIEQTFGFESDLLSRWNLLGIVFVKTYVGAAYDACVNAKIIRPSGLRRVCVAAVDDFKQIMFSNPKIKELKRLELNSDLDLANEALVNLYGLPKVDYIQAESQFPLGAVVYSQLFGEGYVCDFDVISGIYRVTLRYWHATVFCTAGELALKSFKKSATIGFFPATTTTTDVHEEQQQRMLSRKDSSSSYTLETEVLGVGTKVETKWGPGIVRRWRAFDQIYEVQMVGISKHAIGYLQEGSLRVVKTRSRRSRVLSYVKNALFSASRERTNSENSSTSNSSENNNKSSSSPRAKVGVRIVTAYGEGVIVNEHDGMCEVKLEWGAKLYMPRTHQKHLRIGHEEEEMSLSSGDEDDTSGANSPSHRPMSTMKSLLSKAAEVVFPRNRGKPIVVAGNNNNLTQSNGLPSSSTSNTSTSLSSSSSSSSSSSTYEVGKSIQTPYGKGQILEIQIRSHDDDDDDDNTITMYKIQLEFGAILFSPL